MAHPFVDLGNPIIAALGAGGAISVTRYPAGSYDPATGKWIQGIPTVIPMDAVVQPSGPRETQQLPENERTKEAITIFTRSALQTSLVNGQLESDVITWAGRNYKVMVVEDWTAQAQYARSIAVRLGV